MSRMLLLVTVALFFNCFPFLHREPEITNNCPQITREQVQILFAEPDKLVNSYVDLGTFARSDDDYGNLIEDLQEKAIELCGNAVLIIQQGSNLTGSAFALGNAAEAKSSQQINLLVKIIKIN